MRGSQEQIKRLIAYTRPHVWLLAASLLLVAIVGALEAISPFLIGLVFDTVLRSSAAPTISLPLIDRRIDIAGTSGMAFLVLLVVVTVIKAVAEYGSILTTSHMGQAVVRDLRNCLFERIVYQRSEEHTSELQSHSFISYAVF